LSFDSEVGDISSLRLEERTRGSLFGGMLSKTYYVYIVANAKNGIIYIGSTSNLEQRIHKHKLKLIDGFSKKYNTTMLVYYETTDSAEAMITRERQLKHWKRDWKIGLINTASPEWKDLAI